MPQRLPLAPAGPPGDIATALRVFPLLAGLAPAAVARLAKTAHRRTYAAGEIVFRQGEPARGFHAVTAGGIRVVRMMPDGRERVLHRIKPGQTFAEAAVLSMPAYPATAIAAGATETIEVAGPEFVGLVETDPAAARAIISSLAGWLVHLVGRVEELTALSADARLARYLLDLPSHGAAAALEVTLPLAKKDLAAHLGITPETFSRVLRRWTDRGIVASKGATVTISDTAALMAISEGEGS
ncbi:MAG: Crp/Fnr family transcriptional regulator [Planctomycetes bacterium]|nr:Crp/Fnr family transcriptional regulator [Planctomycetota bacterium]